MTRQKIGLVTCIDPPERDPDEALQLEGFSAAGAAVEMVSWDDPAVDPGSFDLLLLRSCWNYYQAPDQFLEWLDLASSVSSVLNPREIIRWNIHKSYLLDLESAGIPVIPTRILRADENHCLESLILETGWKSVVIKPAISAGSFLTRRFEAGESEEAQQFVDRHIKDRDLLIQPFRGSLAKSGERALIYVAGEFTHVVIKEQRFSGDDERVSKSLKPLPEEIEFASGVIAQVDSPLLYGRIDSFIDGNGVWTLAELELIEPSLYFLQNPQALEVLISAALHHIQGD